MIVFRTIDPQDLNGLAQLIPRLGPGNNGRFQTEKLELQQMLRESHHSFFSNPQKPQKATYVFILEDLAQQKIVGFSKVHALVNHGNPFFYYELRFEHKQSEALGICKKVASLHLVDDASQSSELSGSFIVPEYRGKRISPLLTIGRLLFMAAFPRRFANRVVGELRGVYDAQQKNPFWQNCLSHFVKDWDYPAYLAAIRSGLESEIRKLLPIGPIYLSTLSPETQSVIGEAHPESQSQIRLIQRYGFTYRHRVAYSSGAPIVEADFGQILPIRKVRKASVQAVRDTLSADWFYMSNNRIPYRACLGPLEHNLNQTVTITHEVAQALQIHEGDSIQLFPR